MLHNLLLLFICAFTENPFLTIYSQREAGKVTEAREGIRARTGDPEPRLPMTSTQSCGCSWLEGSHSQRTAKGWHYR